MITFVIFRPDFSHFSSKRVLRVPTKKRRTNKPKEKKKVFRSKQRGILIWVLMLSTKDTTEQRSNISSVAQGVERAN